MVFRFYDQQTPTVEKVFSHHQKQTEIIQIIKFQIETFGTIINSLGLSSNLIIGMILKQSKFNLTPLHIKQRLVNIIEHRLQKIIAEQQKSKNNVLFLNQSLLQEWASLIDTIVYFKDVKEEPTKAIRSNSYSNQIFNNGIEKTQITLPLKRDKILSKYLLNINTNSIDVYKLSKDSLKSGVLSSHYQRLNFKKGLARRYSSYNFYDAQNAILIGGSRQSNPNIKSNQIFHLNLNNQQIVKIAELPEGISSHATVKISSTIYIIGGNKDLNIVTKSCYKFNLEDKSIQTISPLNFPSASHTVISWRDQFIYKIGGIGSCFGQWDLSPYIEKYNIQLDQWTVINPILTINEKILSAYSLLVHSLVYLSNKNSIVVLGGLDFNQEASNKILQIQIKQEKSDNHLQQSIFVHQITKLGIVDKLEAGAFMQQECIYFQGQIIALLTVDNIKEMSRKIVRLGKKIEYL